MFMGAFPDLGSFPVLDVMRLPGGKGGTNCGEVKGRRFGRTFRGVFKSIIQTIKKVRQFFKSIK
jgi:hypothetical protein